MCTSRWKEHHYKALRLWLASPVVCNELLTVFHIILPQVVFRTIAQEFDKVLYLSLAATLS